MAELAGVGPAALSRSPAAVEPERLERRTWPVIAIGFAVAFTLQTYLVFAKSINWDEFFHFHHILELRTGTLTRSLQVVYIRWFDWLFDLPLDPVDQLLVGRLVLLPCMAVIAAAIFGLACQFASRPAAALCALAYVTGGYVLLHGFAFRTDPQATALLMAALWLFASRKLGWLTILAIAAMLALAMMITVKSVFYAPAFAGFLFWRMTRGGEGTTDLWRSAAMLGFAAVLFAILFVAHGSTLAAPPVTAGSRELASAGSTVFSEGLFPQAQYLGLQVLMAPFLSAMIALSPLLWRRRPLTDRAALTGLLLPLATLIFYRNAYPYYFVFLLAPAAVTIGPVLDLLLRRFGVAACSLALVANAAVLTAAEPRKVIDVQRSTSAAVHRMFGEPVTYLDFCGFIGDFPRALPFLTSGWGLKRYRLAGRPKLAEAMARDTVPLVINNHPVIEAALTGRHNQERLLEADEKVLRENFVHHWGLIWVAGKRIPAGSGTGLAEFAVPGAYTVEGAPIAVDGRTYREGEVVMVRRGVHRIVADPARAATLRWGRHLPKPNRAAPDAPLFTDY